MWFKKREKEYSPEEAADIMRKELAPFWFRSPPLLCGALLENGEINPQPLDPAMREGMWVLVFSEAAGSSLVRGREVFREWERRFAPIGVKFVFIFRARYGFLQKKRGVEKWLAQNELKSIAFADATGLLSRAFADGDAERADGEVYPRMVVLKQGEIIYNATGDGWIAGAESVLASALRENSLGLPLLPIFNESHPGFLDAGRWLLHAGSPAFTREKMELIGKWKREDDKITTGDPAAEIRLQCPGNHLTLVAQSFTEELTPTRILFQSRGSYFSETQAGADFAVDDEGRSSTLVSVPRAYSLLKFLEPSQREITLQFPNARVTTVAVYALEFSASARQRE